MLVLSRRTGERICITVPPNQEIWLEVAEIDRSHRSVRIGIAAPPEILIEREEIYKRKRSEAGGSAPPG